MLVKIGQNLLFENITGLDLESEAVVHPVDGVLQVRCRADLKQHEDEQGHVWLVLLLVGAGGGSLFLASLRI